MPKRPNADQLLDDLVTLLEPMLEERGFVKAGSEAAGGGSAGTAEYDAATCRRFLSPEHVSDRVLERAQVFFALLVSQGEVDSLEVVDALELKGPRSIPANLTNALKKSARRLRLEEPWEWGENADGTRTVWTNRDRIAEEMLDAIAAEKGRRERGR
jgi:hypothetical protein